MENKKVFIIGNGFDLDLGLNTRYSDFRNSSYWPIEKNEYFQADNISLRRFLSNKTSVNRWFDLEQILLVYAKLPSFRTLTRNRKDMIIEDDKELFVLLLDGLTAYLNYVQNNLTINKDSIAVKVLKAVIENGCFSSIYSFNYTDMKLIGQEANLTGFEYSHVHGCLKDNSIILGVEDGAELNPGFSFLYKTFSKHYESHPIQYDLLEANEVVFFGHSLGVNDYHYFQEFFQRQCDEKLNRKDSKRITFFTYDDASRILIMEQLHSMNHRKTDKLFMLNDVRFFCTKDGMTDKLSKFLCHLKEDNASSLYNSFG